MFELKNSQFDSYFLEGFDENNQMDLWKSILEDRKNVARKYIWPGFNSFEDLKSYMDDCNKENSEEFGFVLKGLENKVLGTLHIISIDTQREQVEIGYGLHLEATGKGIATKAVSSLLDSLKDIGIKKVFAECDDKNEKSWRVVERCNFSLVARGNDRRKYAKVLDAL